MTRFPLNAIVLIGIIATALSTAGCLSEEPEGLAPAAKAETTVKLDFFHRPLPEIPLPNDIATRYDPTSATGRRVSIEYALIRDINDQQWRAEALADLLTGRLAHVNLIPLNPTPGSKWTASRQEDEDAFVATLRRRRIPVSVRDTRGQEIDGACGQLAAAD